MDRVSDIDGHYDGGGDKADEDDDIDDDEATVEADVKRNHFRLDHKA